MESTFIQHLRAHECIYVSLNLQENELQRTTSRRIIFQVNSGKAGGSFVIIILIYDLFQPTRH